METRVVKTDTLPSRPVWGEWRNVMLRLKSLPEGESLVISGKQSIKARSAATSAAKRLSMRVTVHVISPTEFAITRRPPK